VTSWGYGNKPFGDIQAMVSTEAIYVGKTGGKEARRQMGDIQKHPIAVSLLHFIDDAAGHYVSGGQLGLSNIVRHEPMPFHVPKYAPLPSDCLGDQERSYSRQAKNAGMKLEDSQR
jgi:hypothetical protein